MGTGPKDRVVNPGTGLDCASTADGRERTDVRCGVDVGIRMDALLVRLFPVFGKTVGGDSGACPQVAAPGPEVSPDAIIDDRAAQ